MIEFKDNELGRQLRWMGHEPPHGAAADIQRIIIFACGVVAFLYAVVCVIG